MQRNGIAAIPKTDSYKKTKQKKNNEGHIDQFI